MSTYTQAYFHIIFAVRRRVPCIFSNRERIEKYMTGIITNRQHKVLQIYCMPDHCHIVISQNINNTIPDLMRELKSDSTNFINKNKLVNGRFSWQEGYAAISFSKSKLDIVCRYVKNQEAHHHKKTLEEEYKLFVDEILGN